MEQHIHCTWSNFNSFGHEIIIVLLSSLNSLTTLEPLYWKFAGKFSVNLETEILRLTNNVHYLYFVVCFFSFIIDFFTCKLKTKSDLISKVLVDKLLLKLEVQQVYKYPVSCILLLPGTDAASLIRELVSQNLTILTMQTCHLGDRLINVWLSYSGSILLLPGKVLVQYFFCTICFLSLLLPETGRWSMFHLT